MQYLPLINCNEGFEGTWWCIVASLGLKQNVERERGNYCGSVATSLAKIFFKKLSTIRIIHVR